LLTPASVACADSTTATSRVKGLIKSSSVSGVGRRAARRSKNFSISAFFRRLFCAAAAIQPLSPRPSAEPPIVPRRFPLSHHAVLVNRQEKEDHATLARSERPLLGAAGDNLRAAVHTRPRARRTGGAAFGRLRHAWRAAGQRGDPRDRAVD